MGFSRFFARLFPFVALLGDRSIFFFFSAGHRFRGGGRGRYSFCFRGLSALFASFFISGISGFRKVFCFSSFFQFFGISGLGATFFCFFTVLGVLIVFYTF